MHNKTSSKHSFVPSRNTTPSSSNFSIVGLWITFSWNFNGSTLELLTTTWNVMNGLEGKKIVAFEYFSGYFGNMTGNVETGRSWSNNQNVSVFVRIWFPVVFAMKDFSSEFFLSWKVRNVGCAVMAVTDHQTVVLSCFCCFCFNVPHRDRPSFVFERLHVDYLMVKLRLNEGKLMLQFWSEWVLTLMAFSRLKRFE